jgi:hypothetical protein
MTKAYVLIYDADNGSREDCNIFYSPIEVFADPETRAKRIEFIENNTEYDIGFRTEDLDLLTDHMFDIPENLLPYDDGEDEDNDVSDYNAPTDPTHYLFYAYQAESPWNSDTGDDDMSTMVSICPEDYFRKTGYQWDQHTPLDLSDKISEVAEGLFEYEGTVEDARAELLAMGMKEDTEYTAFIQKHNDYDEDEDQSGKVLAKNWGTLADTDNALMPLKPFAGYIFAVGLADDAWDDTEQVTTVFAVKQDYYTANHKLADESLSIRMPWGFGEIDSGRYEYNGTVAVAKQLLVDLGMQEDEKFTDYCKTLGLET